MNLSKNLFYLITLTCFNVAIAQNQNLNYNKFKQLKEEIATPNVYRTAAGAP